MSREVRTRDTGKTMVLKLAAALHSLLQGLKGRNAYRPERHYMRGPGPKARAATAGQERS